MNKDCAIARDLMPQVIDHIASEESQAFVEGHMADCEPCTQVYADMENDIQGAESLAETGEAVSFKAAMSQLRKSIGWKHIRTTILAVLVAFIVFIAGGFGYQYLIAWPYYRAMPLDAYEINLYQGSSGAVYGETFFLKNFDGSGPIVTFEDGGNTVYVHWTSAIIPIEKSHIHQGNPSYGMRRMTLAPDGTLLFDENTPVREIRQGTKDDYVVVYHAGDIIPLLDPAVDEYLTQQELFFDQMDETYEKMNEAQQMNFEAQMAFQDYIDQWESEQRTEPTETPAP